MGIALVLCGLVSVGSVLPEAMASAGASSTSPSKTSPSSPSNGEGRIVRLPTGDRVALADDGHAQTIVPAVGRSDIRFVSQRYGGHSYVIPSDKLPLVATGELDRERFEVTRPPEQDESVPSRTSEPPSVLATEPSSVSFGVRRWPHDDDTPVRRTLTYRNRGDVNLQLELGVRLRTPNGEPAPSGAVGLSDHSITVPADDTRSITVTTNTEHRGPNGRYTGSVTAEPVGEHRDLADEVATPIAVRKEVESYDLTLKSIGPDGKPSSYGFGFVLRLDNDAPTEVYDPDGTAEIRLPKGTYVLSDYISDPTGFYSLVRPTLRLNRDRTVVADARIARPVRTTLLNREARPALVELGFFRASRFGYSSSVLFDDFEDIYAGQIGPPGPSAGFTGHVSSQWGRRRSDGTFLDSPYTYALADPIPGRFPTGYRRTVSDDDLAVVHAARNAQASRRRAGLSQYGFAPGLDWVTSAHFPYSLPATARHYLDPRARWKTELHEFESDTVTSLSGPIRWYGAGTAHDEQWNAAVFGPALPRPDLAVRVGDSLEVGLPMYSDADGNRGYSAYDVARTELRRRGELVARSRAPGRLRAELPSGRSSYTLHTSAERSSYSEYTTRIEARWRFRSHTTTGTGAPLPLWVVRYAPHVDGHNQDRPGEQTELPIRLEAQPGADVGRVERVRLEVSTDDGSTWRPVRVDDEGEHRFRATFRTPDDARFVSLRAHAYDSRGNEVEQTVIRAYGLAE